MLPSAVPFLLAGLRLAVGRGMIGIVVGEIYGSAAGIGMMINQAGSRFQTDKVFVGVLDHRRRRRRSGRVSRVIERRVEVWRAADRDMTMRPKLEAQDIRLDYVQPRTNTRLDRARRRQSASDGRRVRRHRRPVRLRQDHVPVGRRRPDRRRPAGASWSTARR